MSAFGGKAETKQTLENVRFWPEADILVLLERERDACARLSYSIQHAARTARSVEAID